MKAAAIAIVVSLVAVLLEKDTPQMSLLLVLSAIAATMTFALSFYGELKAMADMLFEATGLQRELFTPIFKIVAISFVARLTGDLCKDSKQSALASAVDIAGTICAILAARPLLTKVLEVLGQWGGGG